MSDFIARMEAEFQRLRAQLNIRDAALHDKNQRIKRLQNALRSLDETGGRTWARLMTQPELIHHLCELRFKVDRALEELDDE